MTRAKKITLITVERIARAGRASMPERYRAMVLIAAWCGLRFGELTELRRDDVDLVAEVIHVRRGVTQATGDGFNVGTPKSDAGVRDVSIPPHLLRCSRTSPRRLRGQGTRRPAVPQRDRPEPSPWQSTFPGTSTRPGRCWP